MEPKEKLLDLCKEEYAKLKDEQVKRIGFRDNLIYVTLVAVGTIFGFVMTNPNVEEVLLIVPWVTFILGWTYIVNDEKISAIGKYLNADWRDQIAKLLGEEMIAKVDVMGWESSHKSDKGRGRRKVFQFIIDVLVFIAPGILALIFLSFLHAGSFGNPTKGGIVIEMILLLALFIELYRQSDFAAREK